jgi:T5SS/PEP-CTERM-associated repeat protein
MAIHAKTTAKWTGKHGTNSWFDAKNWGGGVPTAGETTTFSDGGTWTISLAGSGTAQAGSLTVTTDLLTFTSGTLALTAPQATKGVTEDLIVKGGGAVTISAGATMTAGSNIQLGSATGKTQTAGTLTVAGSVVTPGLYAQIGALNVTGPSGDLSVTNTLDIGTTLLISAGGVVDGGGVSTAALLVGSAGSTGAGTVTVDGAGSALSIANISLGNGNAGTLTVQNGASLTATAITAGVTGNGVLNITGAGSTVSATGLTIGGAPPVASAVNVTSGGSLAIGGNGLTLIEANLSFDTTAHISGTVTSLGGSIDGLAAAGKHGGTATLSAQLRLGTDSHDFNLLTTVSSSSGSVLNLAGGVLSSTGGLLGVEGGHVLLSNGGDSYGGTQIFSGTLELSATGAAGANTIQFMNAGASVLDVDAGVALQNTIAQFYTGDQIDLQGFAFGSGVTGNYNGNFNGGVLTLNDGSSSTSLTLAGNYESSNFTFTQDAVGGTLIKFHA